MSSLKKIDQDFSSIDLRSHGSIYEFIITLSHYPTSVLAPALMYLSHLHTFRDAKQKGEKIDGPEEMSLEMQKEANNNLMDLLDSIMEDCENEANQVDANIINNVH